MRSLFIIPSSSLFRVGLELSPSAETLAHK
ncbi:hypothetical protein CDAR_121391, partial [Caerostris darwini]